MIYFRFCFSKEWICDIVKSERVIWTKYTKMIHLNMIERGENMKKSLKRILGFCALAFAIVPMVNVSALETETVSTAEAFVKAAEDPTVKTIILNNDIETTHKVNVTSDKVIDGQGHKITYVGTFKGGSNDNTVWGSDAAKPYDGGVYVIQAYNANVTVKNITLTGGNVGLSANGANLTLEGTIDVSGNGYGGIELTKGQAPDLSVPSLTMNNVTLVNDSESATVPTLYTDALTTEEVTGMNIEYNGVKAAVSYDKEAGKPAQVLLFLDETKAPTGEKYTALDAADFQPAPVVPEEPTPTPTPTPAPDTTVSENPNTFDGITTYVAMAVMGLFAVVFSSKKVYNKING